MIYLNPLQSGGYTLVPFLPISVGFFIHWHGRYLIHVAMLLPVVLPLNHHHFGIAVLVLVRADVCTYFKAAMRIRDYKDQIIRAARPGADGSRAGGDLIDKLAAQLADNEKAKDILRRKGYGITGMSASESAQRVPDASLGA